MPTTLIDPFAADAPPGRTHPDYRLEDFVLNPENRTLDRLDISSLIVGEPAVEMTMDGASQVTIPIEDSTGRLLTGNLLTGWTWGHNADTKVQRFPSATRPAGIDPTEFDPDHDEKDWILDGRKIEAKLDDWPFQLARLDDNGAGIDLVFEDSNAALMREHRGSRKMFRDRMTRVGFCVSLAHAAGVQKIWAPEWSIRQPVLPTDEPLGTHRTRSRGGKRATRGKLSGTFQGKEGKLGPGQLRNAEMVLDEALKQKAPTRAILALLIACMQEAPDFTNPTHGDGTSVGILQLTNIHLGGSKSTNGGRRDVRLVARLFLTKGFASRGSANGLARANPHMKVAEIAAKVQGNLRGAGDYAPHVEKAKKILAAYGGSAATGSVTTKTTVAKRFAFERERNENSWDATGRLLGEVDARRFSRAGYVFFVSDAYLKSWPPKFTIAPGMDGVESIGSEIDLRARNLVAEVTANVHVDQWEMWPGLVVRVRGKGPADGLWLVWSVRKPLHSTLAEVTLRKAVPLKNEPAPETKTFTRRPTNASSSAGELAGASNLRARIVAIAERSQTKHTGYRHYSQPGRLTADPTPPSGARSDCSQWTRACYLKAGAKDPGVNTWAQVRRGRRTSKPKPGDLIFPASQSHVEMYVGNGRTIGHGSRDIDGWSLNGMRNYFGSIFFVTFDFLH